MKKLSKILGLTVLTGILFCMSGCSGLFGGNGFKIKNADDVKEYMSDEDAINHAFYLSDDKTGYIYYTSTTAFNYKDYDNCIYQMSFTPGNSAATKGTWKLYTRPISSTKTIEMVYEGLNGTFEGVNNGSVRNGGTVKLLLDGQEIDTISIENKQITTATGVSKTAYAFTLNVVAAHKYIGAEDVK